MPDDQPTLDYAGTEPAETGPRGGLVKWATAGAVAGVPLTAVAAVLAFFSFASTGLGGDGSTDGYFEAVFPWPLLSGLVDRSGTTGIVLLLGQFSLYGAATAAGASRRRGARVLIVLLALHTLATAACFALRKAGV